MKFIFYIAPDFGSQPYRFDSVLEMEEYIYNHKLDDDTEIVIKTDNGDIAGSILVSNYKLLNQKNQNS